MYMCIYIYIKYFLQRERKPQKMEIVIPEYGSLLWLFCTFTIGRVKELRAWPALGGLFEIGSQDPLRQLEKMRLGKLALRAWPAAAVLNSSRPTGCTATAASAASCCCCCCCFKAARSGANSTVKHTASWAEARRNVRLIAAAEFPYAGHTSLAPLGRAGSRPGHENSKPETFFWQERSAKTTRRQSTNCNSGGNASLLLGGLEAKRELTAFLQGTSKRGLCSSTGTPRSSKTRTVREGSKPELDQASRSTGSKATTCEEGKEDLVRGELNSTDKMMMPQQDDEVDKRVIVVLGQQLNPDGSMTKILEDRVETAASLYQRILAAENVSVPIIVAGGVVEKIALTESQLMKEALVGAYGVDASHVFIENQSTTTVENALYVKEMLEQGTIGAFPKEILLITSEFHMARAKFLFEQRFGKLYNFTEVPAPNDGLPTEDGDLLGHINQYSLDQRRTFEHQLLTDLRAQAALLPQEPELEVKTPV